MSETHVVAPKGFVPLGREVVLTTIALLIIAVVAVVVFFEPARSSPEVKQFVPAYGSNPGVRGEGGR
jgi:hypothetical protein